MLHAAISDQTDCFSAEPLHLTAPDVINRAFDDHAADLRMQPEVSFQPRYRMFDIQAAGFVRILFLSDRFLNIFRDVPDLALIAAVELCAYSAAARMPQNDDMAAMQMFHSILDAPELMMIQHISGHTDHKKFPE